MEEGYEAGLTYIPDESSSLKINVFHRDATDVIAVDKQIVIKGASGNCTKEECSD